MSQGNTSTKETKKKKTEKRKEKKRERAFYDGLNEDEAWDLMDLSKAEGMRGSDNHNRYLVLFPCGEDGWTDEELFDDL